MMAIIDDEKPTLHLMEVPTVDNGREVLWVESAKRFFRVISVPVFAYGLSRGTIVHATTLGDRLHFSKVIQASSGGTIRCYLQPSSRIDDVLERLIRRNDSVGWGAATIFKPDVLAIEISTRAEIECAARYLDSLVIQHIIKFWELADPVDQDSIGSGDDSSPPWELVHPLPIDGQTSAVFVH